MSAIPSPSFLVPQWHIPMPNVGALMTTRTGGVSTGAYGGDKGQGGLNLGLHVGDDPVCVMRNRALLRTCVPSEPVWLNQVHGCRVVDAQQVGAGTGVAVPEADAVLSAGKAVCAIMMADCLPVLLADIDGRVVGAVHAGWRGLAAGVLERALECMRAAGAGIMQAWLGAAIGAQRFEVGDAVRTAFVARCLHSASCFRPLPGCSDKYLCDIYGLARLVLAGQGVTLVSGGDHCTASEAAMFYSFRRDGVTGRMAACIWRD